MNGDLAREVLEVVVERDEVRLALHLDQDADALLLALACPAHVGVGRNDALRGAASATLCSGGCALLAEDLDRLLLVALGLLECLLDVHHRSAGALAKRLHLCGTDRHQDSPPLLAGVGSGAASGSSLGGG